MKMNTSNAEGYRFISAIIFITLFMVIFIGCTSYVRRTNFDVPSSDELHSMLQIYSASDSVIIRNNITNREFRLGDKNEIRDIVSMINVEIIKPGIAPSQDYTLIFITGKRISGSLWFDSKLLTWGIIGSDNELGRCDKDFIKKLNSYFTK